MRYVKWIRYLLPLCLVGCGIDHNVNGSVEVDGKVDTSGTQVVDLKVEQIKVFLTQECLELFKSDKQQKACTEKLIADLEKILAPTQ